ncbi:ribulose-phosphate 3-epimerase [Alkalibacter rhizosphaerae]|uniref:Ribulose-phosphate 3-epimerase n=1 Tax=Alkalibacter rhizosphaerae TaxID=2815577 RepID=A0A974XD27_9FIRM|nr:ribulose-phosphate 3-epimerase [Alkalibacter rhizosphaerae]QSX07588.1 ribulose-phosphate 3-epimerase [Alkalibacter rhizosphaerae]
MDVKIAPSILGADFGNLERDIKKVEECRVEMLHIDVMDGNFVPNIAFGPDQIKMLRGKTDLFFDVHLMIQNPDLLIPRFAEAGADMIVVHQEATVHLHRTLKLIQSFGVKAGVSLTPATSLETLRYVLDEVDMVLLMTVNPGYGGQSFIPACYDKIRDLKKMIAHRPIDIQVDGGINLETAKKAVAAGANVLVAGSFTFKGDVAENIRNLRETARI